MSGFTGKMAASAATAALGCALAFSFLTPASASTPVSNQGALTFYSGAFSGQTFTVTTVPSECTALPITAHSEMNLTEQGIEVYETSDCTGIPLSFPAEDIHGFAQFDGLSFRAAD